MTNKLPIFLSIPHAGLSVPPEVQSICLLNEDQIRKDGDEGASEIYAIEEHVQAAISTDIARAFVDLNRAEDDLRPDGVVKTTTIWGESIYRETLNDELIETLIQRYHRPYHDQLRRAADSEARLFVDCHTMADEGPPVGPDTGQKRPLVCLGDCQGTSLPPEWSDWLMSAFRESFGDDVTLNQPFSGGYITQTQKQHAPWIQLEFSRTSAVPDTEKRKGLLHALGLFCERITKA